MTKSKVPVGQRWPILFSGLTATSKSHYSKLIAEELRRPWVDATSQMLALTSVQCSSLSVWSTDLTSEIQRARSGDKLDKLLDEQILSKIRETPDAVVDAWATPWLWQGKAVRVFLTADEQTRIERCLFCYPAAKNPTAEKAQKLIAEKDAYTRDLFLRLYGFDLFKDHADFDIILDTSGYEPDTPTKTGKQISRERILPIICCAIRFVLGDDTGAKTCDVIERAMADGTLRKVRGIGADLSVPVQSPEPIYAGQLQAG